MKIAGFGLVGLLVVGGIAFFLYKKMKDNQPPMLAAAPAAGSAPMAKASRATYYNPYSYNARYALMSSISPFYKHKGYFSAPQHSIGSHNVMPAFAFDRDDEE